MVRGDADDLAHLDAGLKHWLSEHWDGRGPLLFVTGAGVSAESGIPTFRGEEGYWRIGSRNYFPEELATRSAFGDMSDDIWGWYLYRRSVCRAATPNPAHTALVELERQLVDDGAAETFLLLTQNVDGLHLRAGNSLQRTYQVHGNIDYFRCLHDCDGKVHPLPKAIGERWAKGQPIGDAQRRLLACPTCGGAARPHVLWFDEFYDEAHFRFESALRAAQQAAVIVVVGTSGNTNLPLAVVRTAVARRAPLLVINRDASHFSDVAEALDTGFFVQGAAGSVLPSLVEALLEQRGRRDSTA